MRLTVPMRDLLWTIAQHKYGWAHCPNHGGRLRRLQTAEALERGGLVKINRSKPHMPTCSPTAAGLIVIRATWPISPYVLGTYDHQPGGWTPREAVDYAPPDDQDAESVCGGCRRHWGSALVPPRAGHFSILNSRTGKYHSGGLYGMTDCGVDATGDGWLWPL